MGLFQFGLFAILVLCIAYAIIWIAAKLAPGHPEMVDNIIWVLAVVIIGYVIVGLLGLHDVAIPRVFSR